MLSFWELPFLALCPILLHIDNMDQLFMANKQLHRMGQSKIIRSFWIHKHFKLVSAALLDATLVKPESNSVQNTARTYVDSFPLSLLNLSDTCESLIESLARSERRDLWEVMIVVAARWGHVRVIDYAWGSSGHAEASVDCAFQTAIAHDQIAFIFSLLDKYPQPLCKLLNLLKYAIHVDKDNTLSAMLRIYRNEHSKGNANTPLLNSYNNLLQDCVCGAKFKSLKVLLADIQELDRTSWLNLVKLASAGGSHDMISIILQSGAYLNNSHTGDASYEMEGWKLGIESAILRAKASVVEHLMSLAPTLKLRNLGDCMKGLIELALREGQIPILWTLVDTHESVAGVATEDMLLHALQFYSDCYDQDVELKMEERVKNIRGRDTKGILAVLRGIISYRKLKATPFVVRRNLLLLAVTWNLSATFSFLQDNGFELGNDVEPIMECLLRLIRAPAHFEIPASHLVMKLVENEATRGPLFQYHDGLLLRTLALPQSRHFLSRKGRTVWEVAIKMTPIHVYSHVLSMQPRCEEFAFHPPMRYFAILATLLLSLAHAQMMTIPAGSLGNAACEADYNSMTQAFIACGVGVQASTVPFANGTNSVIMCLCKPENLNTLTGFTSSCASIPGLDQVLSSTNNIVGDCAAFASRPQLPPTSTASTAPPPGGLTPSKECEAARNNLITVWSNCGVTFGSTSVSVLNQPTAVKCMCDNYSAAESAVITCERYTPPAEFGAAKQLLSELEQSCGGPTGAQTSAKTSAKTSAQATAQSSAAQSSVKSGAVGSVDMSFVIVAMLSSVDTNTQAPTTTASAAPGALTPSKECTAARTKFGTVWNACGLPETIAVAEILNRPPVVKCMCDSYSIVEADVTVCEDYMLAKDLAAAKQFLSDLKQRCPATTAAAAAQTNAQADAQTSAKTSAQATAQVSAAQSSVKSGAVGSVDMSFAGIAMVAAFAVGALVN
ncbi:hypothetical protein HDU80_009096 [Chytriomyces hyalinus]|nr:hypothetical protein HDU80_009096 [Chytriomyces hyalinus]